MSLDLGNLLEATLMRPRDGVVIRDEMKAKDYWLHDRVRNWDHQIISFR